MSDKISKLRAALEGIQWGSCDGCSAHNQCPECKAYRYEYGDLGEYSHGKHTPNCSVGIALQETMVFGTGTHCLPSNKHRWRFVDCKPVLCMDCSLPPSMDKV